MVVDGACPIQPLEFDEGLKQKNRKTVDRLRKPFRGGMFFVQQDNWALPAVENALLVAMTAAERVRGALR